MMRKNLASKLICIIFTFVLCLLMLTGCGSAASAAASAADASGTITLFNSDPTISDELGALAKAYEKERGVQVKVINCPTSADSQAILKQYYRSGNLPDIISCDASALDSWGSLLTDLSGQSWCSDTDYAYTSSKYGTIGFPYCIEGIGIAYNAEILKKLNIDPSFVKDTETFTSVLFVAYSLRDSLKLTSVVACCASPAYLSSARGTQLFGAYLDSGQERSDTALLDKLSTDEPLEHDRAFDYAFYLSLIQHFSDKELLLSGTYEDQLSGFAKGDYAFITQGSWAGRDILKKFADAYSSSGNFDIGYLPFTFQSGLDTLLVDAPLWWAVTKGGSVEEAQRFLSWCSGESAQKLLVEDMGFISPFRSCRYKSSNPFAPSVEQFSARGKTSGWHWMALSPGMRTNAVAPVLNDYAQGKLGIEEFLTNLSKRIRAY